MIQVPTYLRATGVHMENGNGQHLLFAEIAGALGGCESLWFPRPVDRMLSGVIMAGHGPGFQLRLDDLRECVDESQPPDVEAIYLATPTLVDGVALFEEEGPWNLTTEERTYEYLQAAMEKMPRLKLLITALGSGDIDPRERMRMMGGGSIVCFKRFVEATGKEFSDWVLCRRMGCA